jgi:hypothetical protein
MTLAQCQDSDERPHPSGTFHRRGHLLVTPQCLHSQRDSLQLNPHLGELLDIPSCPDQILR